MRHRAPADARVTRMATADATVTNRAMSWDTSPSRAGGDGGEGEAKERGRDKCTRGTTGERGERFPMFHGTLTSKEMKPLHDRPSAPTKRYPVPLLQTPGLARDGLPGGGGGDCKGISRQTVVPSTDASKENTCEATFALMRCQCVSSNTNVNEDPKER